MSVEKNYFQTFCNLSQAFGTAATVEELLHLIVKSAVDTMNGKAACLFLEDKKQDVFVPRARYGLSDSYIHANPFRAKKMSSALEKSGHLVFVDAANDQRLENREAKAAEGIASLMTVGVRVDDQMIGALTIYTSEKRNFTDGEVVFLKALAANGGVALKKAFLIERIEKNSLLFLELSSAINSSIDIRDVLNSMTEKTSKAMDLKGVSILLLDHNSNDLDLVASYGLSDEIIDKARCEVNNDLSQALEGKTVKIDDLNRLQDSTNYRELTDQGVSSILTVPIRAMDENIGVMRLYSDSPRNYSKGFLMLIEAVAHTGALAIQNASMYLALKMDKESLEEDIWSHRLYF